MELRNSKCVHKPKFMDMCKLFLTILINELINKLTILLWTIDHIDHRCIYIHIENVAPWKLCLYLGQKPFKLAIVRFWIRIFILYTASIFLAATLYSYLNR